MADISNRLKSLQKKHEQLDKEIEKHSGKTGNDTRESVELKKSKLLLKDEIKRLQNGIEVV